MAEPANKSRQSSPFRQQALEYITTPKVFHDLMPMSSPLLWVGMIALWLAFAVIILWCCFGSIATRVSGKGLLLTEDQAIVYVSALTAPQLQAGMSVNIGPDTGSPWELRRVRGSVIMINHFPASPDDMLAVLKNPSLVNYFLQKNPVVALQVQLAPDHSSLRNKLLIPGSLIDVRIIVHRQSPLSLALSR